MKTQETWTLAAALSAVLGIAMAFTFWWWYFDGVDGAGERYVRSTRDARLFDLWSYAHLPLYLGIGVAGVGAEHAVRFAPVAPFQRAEAWMLCGGLALAMTAVTTIAASRPHADVRAVQLVRHYALAAATLVLGVAGPHVSPAAFLLALVALGIAQLVVTLHASASRDEVAPHQALAVPTKP